MSDLSRESSRASGDDTSEVQRILEARAVALARPQEETTGNGTPLLVVRVGEERYGAPVVQAREVQPLRDLRSVPGLPPHWAGIVNVRGALYPVLSLQRYLGLPDPGESARPMLLLLEGKTLTIGVVVDEVIEIRQVAEEEFHTPVGRSPAGGPHPIARTTADLLSLLDVEAILADPRLSVQEE